MIRLLSAYTWENPSVAVEWWAGNGEVTEFLEDTWKVPSIISFGATPEVRSLVSRAHLPDPGHYEGYSSAFRHVTDGCACILDFTKAPKEMKVIRPPFMDKPSIVTNMDLELANTVELQYMGGLFSCRAGFIAMKTRRFEDPEKWGEFAERYKKFELAAYNNRARCYLFTSKAGTANLSEIEDLLS